MVPPINNTEIRYTNPLNGKKMCHHVLIAEIGNKRVLLSHPNLYISEKGASSIRTSKRYINVISMFYRFLSTQEKYNNVDLSKYHVIADNNDINKWQLSRQENRIINQSLRPTTETITGDAIVLLGFFKWLIESGFVTNVNLKMKNHTPNWKRKGLFAHLQHRNEAKEIIDYTDFNVLDKISRQKKMKGLIRNEEIKLLLKSYVDPVYPALYKFALGTALRPFEIVQFPYIGNGRNAHLMPFSDMAYDESPEVEFTVLGKLNKVRTIKINKYDLEKLEQYYIRPFYYERAKKYYDHYGKKCPPTILFLTERGHPVTAQKIANRTGDAKNKAKKIDPQFSEGITFYSARHWWPTMYLIEFFKEKILTEAADVLYLAVAEKLKAQMGHEDIETTFKFYIDKAKLIYMAHRGLLSEIVTGPRNSIEELIEKIDGD